MKRAREKGFRKRTTCGTPAGTHTCGLNEWIRTGKRLPRWDRVEMVFLKRDAFRILIDAAPDYWRPLVEFRVASGGQQR